MAAISDNIMITGVTVKGYFEENCYFYIDDQTKHGFLIDPGAQAEGLLRMIRKEGWTIEKILLTHGHFDHTGAVNDIRKALGIPVYAYEDADMHEMKLVIAEKPSVAQSLACVIGATKRQDGYLEGSGYLVSWRVGHLVEL